MNKIILILLALVCLLSFTYAADSNSNEIVPTNIQRNDLIFIQDILSELMRGIWSLIDWIFEGIKQLIMSIGLNEFQAGLAMAMVILAFSAWKAGSIADLVDKLRWIILFIVALVLIGILTGVII